jgi:O-antigen ligase
VRGVTGRGIDWLARSRSSEGRASAVYPDLNAAGSLFALLAITALLLSRAASMAFVIAVVPVLLVALLATQSRAAMIAAVLVLGGVVAMRVARPGRRAAAAAVIGLIGFMALAIVAIKGPAQVSPEAALSSRFGMWRVALKIARDDPWFGVGAGQFQTASRDYLSPAFIASFPEAAVGENAHNIFLQYWVNSGSPGLSHLAGYSGRRCGLAGSRRQQSAPRCQLGWPLSSSVRSSDIRY